MFPLRSLVEGEGRRPFSFLNPFLELGRHFLNAFDRRWGHPTHTREELVGEHEEPDEVAETPTSSGIIQVDSVDLYVMGNAKSHHTEKYDLLKGKHPSAVFRRGEAFTMSIRFNRPFNVEKDNVKIKLSFGSRPNFIEGTMVPLHVTSEKEFTKDASWWDIAMSRNEHTTLTLEIQIPYSAFVGIWTMNVESGDNSSTVFKCKESIYILFNPWNKEDPVYMEDEKMREEYVLNDTGKVFMGTYNNPKSKPWQFSQFECIVLPTCIRLLDKFGLQYTARSNPVRVVRAVSATMNAEDENGLLYGRWEEPYYPYHPPWHWQGSLDIFREFFKTDEPVRYGQCWVFSGVCTTACRALGIPCRSVTNYNSAHDANENITVDEVLTERGDKVKCTKNDSYWNFHVWNDCWMARSDLPQGYGGWQAVDSTPQEMSEGAFQTGPTSLVAIKRGEINHIYDSPFVFAEVNADIFRWQAIAPLASYLYCRDDIREQFKSEHWTVTTDNYLVGKLLATKMPGYYDETGMGDLQDISHFYKPKEGSAMERMSVMNAARRINKAHFYDLPHPDKEDVRFSVRNTDQIMIGQTFHVVAEVENLSEEQRTVTSSIAVSSVYYTGVIAKKVRKNHGTLTLNPREKQEFGIHVHFEDYFYKLVEEYMLKVYIISNVKETRQTWVQEYDFQLKTPQLMIEVEEQLKLHSRFSIKLYFTNPIKLTLYNCFISIEGSGIINPRRVQIPDVGPQQTMTHVEHCTPKKTGNRRITAVFYSREMVNVQGSKQVTVEE